MAPQTLVSWDNALKDIFSTDYPHRLFNDEAENYRRFKNRGAPSGVWEGKNYIWNIQSARGIGFGWAPDTATSAAVLPTAGRTATVRAQILPKWFYHAVEASGQVMKLSKTKRAAWAPQIAFEMDDAITNVARRMNMTSFLDGSGVIGEMTALAAGVATMRVPGVNYGFSDVAGVDTGPRAYGVRYFWPGMRLRAQNQVTNDGGGATTIRSGVGEIDDTGISVANNTLTMDPAVNPTDWAATDFLVLAGSQGNFAQKDNGNEMMGLQSLVDDGDIAPVVHNVTRTAVPQFSASVLEGLGTGTARALTIGMLQRAYDQARLRAGKNKGPRFMLTTPGVLRRIQDLILPDVRHVSQDLKAGYTTLNWAGGGAPMSLDWDPDCTYGTLYMLDPGSFFFPVWSELDWIDDDGRVLRLSPQGYHSFVGYLCFALNFGCWAPNHNAVIRELDEDFDQVAN